MRGKVDMTGQKVSLIRNTEKQEIRTYWRYLNILNMEIIYPSEPMENL